MSVFLNTLYVTTPDAYLRLEGETVCVMIEKDFKCLTHREEDIDAFAHPDASTGHSR